MPSRFWDSEANKFTLYGAIFGFLFPIIATIIQAISHSNELSWAAIVQVQSSDPLLWIIDSAPFFLGLFARFAGRRQDQLRKIILESSAAERLQDTQLEDARQFANVLTYLSVGLVAVVLILGVLWLQSFIRSTLAALPTPNTVSAQPIILTPVPVNDNSDDSADSNAASAAVLVVTATSTPTSIPVQPEPTVAPTIIVVTATSTPISVVVQPEPTVAPTVLPTVVPTVAPSSVPTVVLVAAQAPSPTSLPPAPATATVQSTLAATAAPPNSNSIRIGYMVRDLNCAFFTQVATAVWQQERGIAVTVETFNSRDELYAALTSAADPRHVDLTLCFVDPDDREYLIKYSGALHVIGKTYWEGDQKKLLAMANTDAPLLTNPDLACANRFIQKQDYTQLQITSTSAAAWIGANGPLIQSWLDCDTPRP